MPRRDPTDERMHRRLAVSYVISILLHALIALLFVTTASQMSEQSAPEATQGAPAVSVSHIRLSTRAKSTAVQKRAPSPSAPRIAPPQAIPLIAGRPPVPTRRELAKIVPKAPPNPTPAPPAPLQRNPQRVQVAVGTPTPAPIPAVPISAPTPIPIIAPKPQFTTQPTAAPSVAPTAHATLAPRATASPMPLKSPVVATRAVPTHAPTPATAAATPAAAASAAARVAASPAARQTPGVPRPAPSGIASPSAQRGNAPSPGPKAAASAGPGAVPRAGAKPQPPRPINLPPTPSPSPRPTAKPAKLPPQKEKAYADLNARLRKLLPNNAVKPTTKHFTTGPEAMRPAEPTPPPDVLAKTKYIYRSASHRAEDRFTMWVTSLKKLGFLTVCHGWLVRYPAAPPSYGSVAAGSGGPLHGGAVALPDPGPRPQNAFMPIIETDASYVCPASALQPFYPQPAPQK